MKVDKICNITVNNFFISCNEIQNYYFYNNTNIVHLDTTYSTKVTLIKIKHNINLQLLNKKSLQNSLRLKLRVLLH